MALSKGCGVSDMACRVVSLESHIPGVERVEYIFKKLLLSVLLLRAPVAQLPWGEKAGIQSYA
jgi:hypothetical protein